MAFPVLSCRWFFIYELQKIEFVCEEKYTSHIFFKNKEWSLMVFVLEGKFLLWVFCQFISEKDCVDMIKVFRSFLYDKLIFSGAGNNGYQ